MAGSVEKQRLVTVSVEGVAMDSNPWSDVTGGDFTSDETKFTPGGLGIEEAYGGTQHASNPTVMREVNLSRDMALIKALKAVRGRAQATVKMVWIDMDKNVIANSETLYKGVLMTVIESPYSSTSTNVAKLSLVISANGQSG